MSSSVKVNYILTMLNTGSQMLFPLLTFPYICKILTPESIGQVNFYNSIINYIILFTSLGIPMYAIREIARKKNNVVLMSSTTIEIFILHCILTFLGYIVVFALCLFVSSIRINIALFLLLSLSLFFTTIGCEWFYNGIEEFKYITIRGIVVRVIAIGMLFIFVKSESDLLYFGCYSVIGAIGGNIFNFIRLKKYLYFERSMISRLNIFQHFLPSLKVFSFTFITSSYLQLNPIILGFMKDVAAVGYFTTSTKIIFVMIQITTSLGAVMMPRTSNLLSENKQTEFFQLTQKSYDFTLAITIPLTALLISIAPMLILWLCGDKFFESILPFQIISPVIFIVGVSNVFGMQILYPMGRINDVIKCTLIGAIVNLIFNFVLVPYYSYVGTSIAYLLAELATTLSMFFIAKKDIRINCFKKEHLHYFFGSFWVVISLYVWNSFSECSYLVDLVVSSCISLTVYLLFLFFVRDKLFMSMMRQQFKIK